MTTSSGNFEEQLEIQCHSGQLHKSLKGKDFLATSCENKVLKKHYKEVVDAPRQSGAGVNSDNDCPMGFRWFADIHSIVGTRAVVQPSSLMDTSVADSRSRTPSVVEEQQSRIPVV